MSRFFPTGTPRSLSPFVEKQDNKPLHHTRLKVAVTRATLRLLPQGTAIIFIYASMLLYFEKESTVPWKDANNQYDNIKAAD